MATGPDEQIVIRRTGHREAEVQAGAAKQDAPDWLPSSGAKSRRAGGQPASRKRHSAATILPPSHLYIEKLGELRSPVLP